MVLHGNQLIIYKEKSKRKEKKYAKFMAHIWVILNLQKLDIGMSIILDPMNARFLNLILCYKVMLHLDKVYTIHISLDLRCLKRN